MWLPTCSEEEACQHGGHLMHAGQLHACCSRFNTAMHTGGTTTRCLGPTIGCSVLFSCMRWLSVSKYGQSAAPGATTVLMNS